MAISCDLKYILKELLSTTTESSVEKRRGGKLAFSSELINKRFEHKRWP